MIRSPFADSDVLFWTFADFTFDWEFWRDEQGRFSYVSPACVRISGYSADEFLADTDLYQRIVHPDDGSVVEAHILHEKKSSDEHCQLEHRIIHKGGSVRWIGHACQPVYSATGRFLGVRCSNRDITGAVHDRDIPGERETVRAFCQRSAYT